MLGTIVGATNALAAEPVVGRATVIDGDTLEIHGERIRIDGIDAPESRQTCHDRATEEDVRCGQHAALWLSDLIGAQTVTCQEAGRDRYKRMLAHCEVAGQDVGAAMVEAGWALAYVRYSREYEAQEERARNAKAGIWQWKFVAPWDWRRGAR
ncbi:MAG: hypothetical protein B7Z30_00560 [Rhizobiales bacterium 12-68-15]|nr:MAG: hypothetical protein B7Z30_00560 [Rhizobiales bacterium 12-68-15]